MQSARAHVCRDSRRVWHENDQFFCFIYSKAGRHSAHQMYSIWAHSSHYFYPPPKSAEKRSWHLAHARHNAAVHFWPHIFCWRQNINNVSLAYRPHRARQIYRLNETLSTDGVSLRMIGEVAIAMSITIRSIHVN